MIELICNPVAGNGLAVKAAERVKQKLQEKHISFLFHCTKTPGEATRIAKEAVMGGVEKVFSLGGDGTVTEIAAGLFGSKTALGIIPCGTGNDFAKAVGIPKNTDAALDFALEHSPRPVDHGMINNLLFLNICGTGFDVMVLDYADRAKKYVRGIWPYLYGVIRSIGDFRPIPMKVTIDGNCHEGNYMLCCAGNGRYFGGGIPIVPLADVEDGMLEILLVDSTPRWKIPFYLPSILGGTLYNKKISHRYQAKKISIQHENMRVNIDGEIVTMNSADIEIRTDELLLCW